MNQREGFMGNKSEIARNIYLFGVSLIGLVVFIVSFIQVAEALTSIYLPRVNILEDKVYLYERLYQNLVLSVTGFLIFVFHWFFVVKERRLGKIQNVLFESNMNIFESIFFYLLAYVGIIILLTSVPKIAHGFYTTVYPTVEPGKEQNISPYVVRDSAIIVQGLISFFVGLITFIVGFLRTQRSMKRVNQEQ
jgi:hypothetical protein